MRGREGSSSSGFGRSHWAERAAVWQHMEGYWKRGVCGQKVGITSVLLRYPYNDAFWIFEWRCYIHHWLSESGEELGLEILDSSTHSLTTCSLPFGQRFCLITFLSLNAYLAWNKAFCW